MECTKCGEPVGEAVNFCGKCGAPVNLENQPKPDVLSKEMKCKHDVRVLLVGHTGHGKSATGNSLLGITRQEGFHDELSQVSVTQEYKRLVQERFGRKLEVVDTPGVFDTSFDQQFVYEQIYQCIGLTLPGFNAICLVLRPDRFTKELVQTVEIFFKLFGKGVDEYAFVIFTHMETEAEMKNYIRGGEKKSEDDGQKAFEVLRKRCQDKMLFIDNKASKDLKEEMVWNILTAVDEANAKASRPYFVNKITRNLAQKATDFYMIHVCGLGSERSKEDIRILLIGLPGHGKSATGNSLLGKSMFTENDPSEKNAHEQTPRTATQLKIPKIKHKDQSGENKSRKIKIVEFPVKDPSSQSGGDFQNELLQTEKMLHPGFHALCFVIDPNKFSDVKDQFKQFMEYFGNDASDYAFVIMTFTTNENEYEDHFRSKIDIKHPVTSVFEFCKDKELFIDNKVSPAEKEEMIKDIFASIDSANVKKLTPHFSSRFKTLTEAAEAAKTDEAAKAAREAKAALKAAKAAEIKHKQEILMVERKALETYKRDFEKLITEQTDTKAAEAKAAEAELKKELQRERETSRAEIRELALKLDQLASKADEDSYKKDLEMERQAFEAEKKRLEWEVAKQKGIADNFQAHARDLEQRVFQAQFFRSPFYYQPPTDSPKEKSFCTIL